MTTSKNVLKPLKYLFSKKPELPRQLKKILKVVSNNITN